MVVLEGYHVTLLVKTSPTAKRGTVGSIINTTLPLPLLTVADSIAIW